MKADMAYMRSMTSLLFKSSNISALPQNNKSCLAVLDLPSPLLEQIFSYLSAEEFTYFSNTCKFLKEHASTFLLTRRQRLRIQARIQARILQSTIPAANIPNELLQEIFTYLTPKDFYIATRVCASWRYAGFYPRLIKKHISTLRQDRIFERTADVSSYDLQTLITHLHAAGKLGEETPSKHMVSTFYLEQPNSKIPPAIHLSETGHYFLSAEKAPPYQVHIYCTYRPVLADDFKTVRLELLAKNRTIKSKRGMAGRGLWGPGSGSFGFHEWDSTPTHMVTLPCKGKVVSASFSPAVFGGVKYDMITNSYSKGVDVLVLFEGGLAKLFKIRSRSPNEGLGEAAPSRRKQLFKRETSEQRRWYISDSMDFSGIGSRFPNETPILAKLEETSGKAIFATEGHLEVWKGISEYKPKKVIEGGQTKLAYWDKEAAVMKDYELPGAPGNLERLFVGSSWHSDLSLNTVYIICASSPFPSTGEQSNRSNAKSNIGGNFLCHLEPDPNALNTEPIKIRSSFSTLPYTVLTSCEDYNNTPLYLGLTPSSNSLTYLTLRHYKETPYKPCELTPKLTLHYPHEHAIPTHTTSVNIPWHSIHPIIATATKEGDIYISFPPICNSKERACKPHAGICPKIKPRCSCLPAAFKKLARIPLHTGGSITDMKISYRSPVLDSPRRNVLYSKDLQAIKGEKGILVLVISTDQGRLEVCYFGPERRGLGTKRLWVAKRSEVKHK